MTQNLAAVQFLQRSFAHVLHQFGHLDSQPSALVQQLLEHRLALPYASALERPSETMLKPGQNALVQFAAQLQRRHRCAAPEALIEVCDALRAQHIPSLVLKGAAYAHSFYPDAIQRQNTDHDVLVAPEQRKQAHQVLMELGFQADSAQVFQDICGQASYRRIRSAGSVEIDLHWELGNNFALYGRFDFQRLLAQAQPFVIGTHTLLRLSNRWCAIHSALSYCSDHPDQRSFLALLDLALIAQSLDVNEQAELCLLAEQSRTWGVLHFANAQAHTLFGEALFPALAAAQPKKDALFEALWHRFEHSVFWWPLKTPRPLWAKLEFLWRQALPPKEYMFARYGSKQRLSTLHLRRCLSAMGLIPRA